jgi:hypothetical protein
VLFQWIAGQGQETGCVPAIGIIGILIVHCLAGVNGMLNIVLPD